MNIPPPHLTDASAAAAVAARRIITERGLSLARVARAMAEARGGTSPGAERVTLHRILATSYIISRGWLDLARALGVALDDLSSDARWINAQTHCATHAKRNR
jgi:hypothetical protein